MDVMEYTMHSDSPVLQGQGCPYFRGDHSQVHLNLSQSLSHSQHAQGHHASHAQHHSHAHSPALPLSSTNNNLSGALQQQQHQMPPHLAPQPQPQAQQAPQPAYPYFPYDPVHSSTRPAFYGHLMPSQGFQWNPTAAPGTLTPQSHTAPPPQMNAGPGPGPGQAADTQFPVGSGAGSGAPTVATAGASGGVASGFPGLVHPRRLAQHQAPHHHHHQQGHDPFVRSYQQQPFAFAQASSHYHPSVPPLPPSTLTAGPALNPMPHPPSSHQQHQQQHQNQRRQHHASASSDRFQPPPSHMRGPSLPALNPQHLPPQFAVPPMSTTSTESSSEGALSARPSLFGGADDNSNRQSSRSNANANGVSPGRRHGLQGGTAASATPTTAPNAELQPATTASTASPMADFRPSNQAGLPRHGRYTYDYDTSDDDLGSEIIADDEEAIRFLDNLAGRSGSEELRIRAHQIIRGQMTTKRVASRRALSQLQSVDMNSLEESEKTCVICYNEFGVTNPEGINEAPLRLPNCKHVFGDHCIKKWFEESDSCPYCRDKVHSEPAVMANGRPITSYIHALGGVYNAAYGGGHNRVAASRNRGLSSASSTAAAAGSQRDSPFHRTPFGERFGISPPRASQTGERRSPPSEPSETGRRRTRPRHGSFRGSTSTAASSGYIGGSFVPIPPQNPTNDRSIPAAPSQPTLIQPPSMPPLHTLELPRGINPPSNLTAEVGLPFGFGTQPASVENRRPQAPLHESAADINRVPPAAEHFSNSFLGTASYVQQRSVSLGGPQQMSPDALTRQDNSTTWLQ